MCWLSNPKGRLQVIFLFLFCASFRHTNVQLKCVYYPNSLWVCVKQKWDSKSRKENFEDTKWVIISRNQWLDNTMAKRKRTNKELHHTTQKTKSRGEVKCSGNVFTSWSTCAIRCVSVNQREHVIQILWWTPTYVNKYN